MSAPPVDSILNSTFKYYEVIGFDESMKDFAKMTILLAFNEYPNDGDPNDFKRANLVKTKFEDKFGKVWTCAFIKNGDFCTTYVKYFIEIEYKDYNISIWKSSN